MWHKSVVTTFLEKFVLSILAALFLLVITNPMHLEVWPRAAAGLGILLGAYLCARAIHKHAGTGQPSAANSSRAPSEESKALSASVNRLKIPFAADGAKQLRERQGVARLRETQSGKTFAEIPASSYSFMYGHALVRDYKLGDVAVSDDSNLRFEVHKLADGIAHVVAYAGPETRDRLLEGLKKGETLTLYSRSCAAAPDLVAVPLDHLKFNRDRILTIANKQLCALDCEAR